MTNRPVNYFAYGSNMNSKRMESRNAAFSSKVSATLDNYEFVLNYKRTNGTAAANVRLKNGCSVHGVLYKCEHEALLFLDKYEGVDKKCYTREIVSVVSLGEKVEAYTYIACPQSCDDTLNTVSRVYLQHILSGKDLLPEHYLNFLKSFQSWCVDVNEL